VSWCPHDEIMWGQWCPACRKFAPVFAALALSACATLPEGAELVDAGEIEHAHGAWTAAGWPDCAPLDVPFYVYEAPDAERSAMCDRTPAPGSCLGRASISPMRRAWVAVVTPGDNGGGVRHEIVHAFEWQCLGGYDYTHSGPQWSDAARDIGGIP